MHTASPNPIPNPNFIPNLNHSLTIKTSTKTTDLQAEHKHTTKANLRIRVLTSDHSVFRYNMI